MEPAQVQPPGGATEENAGGGAEEFVLWRHTAQYYAAQRFRSEAEEVQSRAAETGHGATEASLQRGIVSESGIFRIFAHLFFSFVESDKRWCFKRQTAESEDCREENEAEAKHSVQVQSKN